MTDHTFLSDESGAVTVDWVVLTAALVGLGLAVMGVISAGLRTTSESVAGVMERDNIIRTSFGNNALGASLTAEDADALRADARARTANEGEGSLLELYTEQVGLQQTAQTEFDAFGDDFATSGNAGSYAGETEWTEARTAAETTLTQANDRVAIVQDEAAQRSYTLPEG
jgi:hypothetical protein